MNLFKGFDGTQLRMREWKSANEKAIVILVHGYAEHIDRYEYLGTKLMEAGISMIGYDHRGHGRSGGKRSYINRFTDYLQDLDIVVSKYRNEAKPIFIYGHSLGGLIVTRYVIDYQPSLAGVIMSGAALKVNEDISPMLQKVSGLVSSILPKVKTVTLDSSMISRDPNEVRKYREDPLIYTEGIPARTGAEILAATKSIPGLAQEFTLPVLIMHGGDDQLTEPSASKDFFAACGAEDKELQIYDGLYHEIMNEPERDEVISNFISWISTRISN